MDCQLREACCQLSVDEMTQIKSGSQKQKSCGIGCLLRAIDERKETDEDGRDRGARQIAWKIDLAGSEWGWLVLPFRSNFGKAHVLWIHWPGVYWLDKICDPCWRQEQSCKGRSSPLGASLTVALGVAQRSLSDCH